MLGMEEHVGVSLRMGRTLPLGSFSNFLGTEERMKRVPWRSMKPTIWSAISGSKPRKNTDRAITVTGYLPWPIRVRGAGWVTTKRQEQAV